MITNGIYYYPEHWNESQWASGIKKIQEMGFEIAHIAQFSWYKMEPKNCLCDFAWLDKVLKPEGVIV